MVPKILSLTLNIYNAARVEVAKSNFLMYDLVPLYWLAPAKGKGHRLVSGFGRSRDVGLTPKAILGSSYCHSSSSHNANLTLRKKPAMIDQAGSKVLDYSLH